MILGRVGMLRAPPTHHVQHIFTYCNYLVDLEMNVSTFYKYMMFSHDDEERITDLRPGEKMKSRDMGLGTRI